MATPSITDLIQLNFLVPRNGRTRTSQFPFQRHVLQLKIRNSSRQLETGKLSLEKQQHLQKQQNQPPHPHTRASTSATFPLLAHKFIWMWMDTSNVQLCPSKSSISQPKGASCAILCVQCGVIYPFQQKGTTFVMFQGKRRYRGTEFLSTGYCTWKPIPQKLSSVKTGPLLDVSVLLEAATYWEQ